MYLCTVVSSCHLYIMYLYVCTTPAGSRCMRQVTNLLWFRFWKLYLRITLCYYFQWWWQFWIPWTISITNRFFVCFPISGDIHPEFILIHRHYNNNICLTLIPNVTPRTAIPDSINLANKEKKPLEMALFTARNVLNLSSRFFYDRDSVFLPIFCVLYEQCAYVYTTFINYFIV